MERAVSLNYTWPLADRADDGVEKEKRFPNGERAMMTGWEKGGFPRVGRAQARQSDVSLPSSPPACIECSVVRDHGRMIERRRKEGEHFARAKQEIEARE